MEAITEFDSFGIIYKLYYRWNKYVWRYPYSFYTKYYDAESKGLAVLINEHSDRLSNLAAAKEVLLKLKLMGK